MQVTLYHNPRCSKSREGLALLEASGANVTVVRYLESGLDLAELQALQRALKLPAEAMIRWKEAEAKALDKTMPEAELLRAISSFPILLERPVGLAAGRAVIGRPPEQLLGLLRR